MSRTLPNVRLMTAVPVYVLGLEFLFVAARASISVAERNCQFASEDHRRARDRRRRALGVA
jgi:hypothetical protein